MFRVVTKHIPTCSLFQVPVCPDLKEHLDSLRLSPMRRDHAVRPPGEKGKTKQRPKMMNNSHRHLVCIRSKFEHGIPTQEIIPSRNSVSGFGYNTQKNVGRSVISKRTHGHGNVVRHEIRPENVMRKSTIPTQELIPSRNSVSGFGCNTQKTWAGV